MAKVSVTDRRVAKIFLGLSAYFATAISVVFLFFDIPQECKLYALLAFIGANVVLYLVVWVWSNKLNSLEVEIDGTSVSIKVGDIFAQDGFKVIAFNEYFDTLVDDKVINERSLNGVFLKEHLDIAVGDLDEAIENYPFEPEEILEVNTERAVGKTQKFKLGTIVVHNDFLLTAFSKFDQSNRAILTMPEYLEFLINFWDRINKVYAQKSVSVTIFGSGITRIKGHKSIGDEDLLKIMLWTFRISEMRFKYPAKLSIIIHKESIAKINLLDVKADWS